MDHIERLAAIEAIKTTKSRYFRFLDTKDIDGLTSVFSANAKMDMSEESQGHTGLVEGARAIAEFILGSVEGVVTIHHGHMPEIDFQSGGEAQVIWAMEDKLWKPEGSISTLPFTFMNGFGHYWERYVREGERWLIREICLKRLRINIE